MAPPFRLRFAPAAAEVLRDLESDGADAKELHATRTALGRLQQDPRHPGLNSHRYESLGDAGGASVWESCIGGRTPALRRIFWHDGPGSENITVLAIGLPS